MDKKDIIGKKAKIVCLTEQLRSIGIKDLSPGVIVEIIKFELDHIVYDEMYKCDDGGTFHYLIPLKWLKIQK